MQDIDKERFLRFNDLRNNGGGSRERFISCLKETFSTENSDEILKALSFSEALDYQHGDLTKETYLSHPHRVSILTMDHIVPANVSTTILALVHNVLEVSPAVDTELVDFFGKDRLKELKTLTIDRTKTTPEYLTYYYQGIYKSTKQARIVKALDKLDNLYMLCLNPDANIRANYLWETSHYVLPIVRKDLPNLTDYYCQLISNCRDIGHLSL